MPTTDLSNNNISSSASPPPPPQPPPMPTLEQLNKASTTATDRKSPGVTTPKTGNSTKLKGNLTKGSNFLVDLQNNKKLKTKQLISEEECESSTGQSELPKPTTGQNSIDKATALKYSIATLLLCASNLAVGISVILAIANVTAISILFAVISALAAFSSAVYFVNSFLSAVNDEKKIDLSEKGSGQPGTVSQESEKSVHENVTNQENKSSMPTPTSPQVTLGAQPNPPPPTSSGTHSSKKTGSSSMPEARISNDDRNALLAQIRGGVALKQTKTGAAKESSNTGGGQQEDVMAELLKNKIFQDMRKLQDSDDDTEHSFVTNFSTANSASHNKETASETTLHDPQNTDQSHRESDSVVQSARVCIANVLFDKVNQSNPPLSNFQSDNEKRSKSLDSDNVSGNDEDWETDPEPVQSSSSDNKVERRSQSPPAMKVNGGVDISNLSFKNARQAFSKT